MCVNSEKNSKLKPVFQNKMHYIATYILQPFILKRYRDKPLFLPPLHDILVPSLTCVEDYYWNVSFALVNTEAEACGASGLADQLLNGELAQGSFKIISENAQRPRYHTFTSYNLFDFNKE